jgi:hypothetical protein
MAMGRLLAFITAVSLVLAAGCVEWTEDSQGNLRSIGIPGVPVWKAQASPTPTPSRQVVSNAPLDPETAELTADASGSTRSWLIELNKWRELAGVRPVSENSRLSRGSEKHARYLVSRGPPDEAGFRLYRATIGAAAHREDRHTPWYTEEGAEAAQGGKIAPHVMQAADVAWSSKDEAADIDDLLQGPFHRFSLLAPWAQVAGFGSFGEPPRRAAALALRGWSDASESSGAVEFPPDGAAIAANAMPVNEWPNPLTACPGYELPVGLPITVQLGHRLELQSYSLNDEGEGHRVEACAFDAMTYQNPDPVQQARGRELLVQYGALMLIPRHPLRVDHRYLVELRTRRHDFNWAFSVGGSNLREREPERRAMVK